jgi:phospholipase C
MGALDEIRHVVVLMFENQSFDRLLGYLTLDDPSQKLDGLTGGESNPMSPPGDMTPIPVTKVSSPDAYVTDPGPGHDFEDVNQQLFGERAPADTGTPRNNGFALNYSWQVGFDRRRLGPRGREIMGCLDPALLPITSALARNFVVCDHWHASVPGPTWPNRFFVHAATANGLLVTPETPSQLASAFWGSPYRMRGIFENLQDRGHDWTVYFDDYSQVFALRNLHAQVDRFQKFERFAADAAAGALPRYSFIEPRSFSAPGYPANDQHPPHNLVEGEKLLANVYDTLRVDEAVWRRSLLVVLYDEHGGFYDHVPPPGAVRPDDVAAKPSGFRFDRLGVRVPALLVSPWVGGGRADHTVYDHTSLLATLKKMLDLPTFLTARDAAAHTFDGNFLAETRDVSLTNLSARVPAVSSAAGAGASRTFSPHQRSLLALARVMSEPPSGASIGRDAVDQAKTLIDNVQGA